jgi:hypothetical protein
MLISLIVLELCPEESSKYKNEQRGITSKLGKVELWFLCTAHLLDEIYLHNYESFILMPLVVSELCPGQE